MSTLEMEIRQALELSEKERIDLIYQSFYGGSFSADDSDRGGFRKAKELYKTLEAKARKIICGSTEITEFAAKANSGDITLALLICDALATVFQKPTIFLMSAQIVSLGVKQFCGIEE